MADFLLDCSAPEDEQVGRTVRHTALVNVGGDMDGTFSDYECEDCGQAFRVFVT